MFYTTDEIIESVKMRTLAPESQPTFTQSEFIRFCNEEFQIKLVPDIITIREDLFLRTYTQNIVYQKTSYTLPNRSIGNTLKDVFFIDTQGNRFPMAHININDIPLNNFTSVYPSNFYVKGDYIVLAPSPNATSGTLEMWYYERPSQLVPVAQCGLITQIQENVPTTGQVTFTVDADVSSYATVDFLSGASPFQDWAIDVVPVSATSTTVVCTMSDLQGGDGSLLINLGDYICNANTACIPMVPQEMHPVLAEYTAARVVQALGHKEKLDDINQNLALMRQNCLNLIANRIEQKNERIINRYSLSRSSGYGWALGWNR